jgi:hypothetical protein
MGSYILMIDIIYLYYWTVKAHGIQVVNLCCLGCKEFKVLKKLRDRFVVKLWGGGKNSSFSKAPPLLNRHCFISPLRDVLSPGRGNSPSGYEATRMWNTRDSLFWGWRRTTEYFRDLFEIDHSKEVHELMAY